MTDGINAGKATAFACDMNAIEPGQRGEHLATISQLFQSVESIRELAEGYAFQLSNDADTLLLAARFIALERLCCPFFGFALEVESEGGALWLSLTGRDGVKPGILAEIGDHLSGSVVKPSGFVQIE
ncbi:MAG TPA: hypothetical protein VNZ44_18145 [Pyrinomonadaceae bacterium]|nr:hypothetical protein [Pyrinomonadaceae bacterium]